MSKGMKNANHTPEVLKAMEVIEPLAVRLSDVNDQIRILEEEKVRLKEDIATELDSKGLFEVTVKYDEHEDIKVSRSLRANKVLNKEELGDFVKVPADSITSEYLLQLVDEKRLTYKDYKRYLGTKHTEQIIIRKK